MTFKRLSAAAVILLMVSIFFAAVVSAQTGTDQYNQAYQTYKEKYLGARNQYTQAEKQFENAKKDFRAAKTTEKDEALFNSTKDYMIKSIDAMIAYLNMIEANANLAENRNIAPYDASANLNKDITQLEQKKLEVQSATNKQQLIDIQKSVKETWLNSRAEVKYYVGYLVNNRLGAFIDKANNISGRFDSQIEMLKSKGIDTTNVESDVATYNEWLSKAETEYNAAQEDYSTHGGFDAYGHVTNLKESDKFLESANKHIRQANEYLKKAKDGYKDAVAELRAINTKKT